ncbi:MAG: HAMP domain-containing histidine kinase [Cytophagales bacterium]|nr:HAMP domain-containing histidine kinase [Cytophagales bacterium]
MNIRARLTLTFTLSVASVILLFSLAVYYSSARYRKAEFLKRLSSKAMTTGRLLLEVDEVDATLLKIIDRNNLTSLPHEQIVVYDAANRLVYDSDDNPVAVPVSDDLLSRIRAGGEVTFREGSEEVVGLLFKHPTGQYVILASAFDQYGLSKLRNLKWILAVASLVSLVVVAGIGWVFSGRAIRPMAEVVREVEQIGVTNMDRRVNTGNGKDEIALLALTFNRMLDRIQRAFEAQRYFVSNASHELRTPLTVITGQIDVALIKRRSLAEYEELLRSIQSGTKSLTRLTNNLLELAQVSAESLVLPQQPVQVDETIYQAALMLSQKYPHYHTAFAFEHPDKDAEAELIVLGDEELLKTAFYNLMENACKFSANHHVDVLLGVDGSSIKVQFIDQGIGITPADRERIFQPFFRGENAAGTRGHGIGLSLTQRIIDQHLGTLTLNSLLDKGTTFTVRLPLAS